MTSPLTEKPYGTNPNASDDDIRRYHRNFAKAQSEQKSTRRSADPAEELVADRLSAYLWSNFDARPYREIKTDIKFIVESRLSRTTEPARRR
jgi:hypothetical protein